MDFGTKPTHTIPKQPVDTSFPTVIPDPPIFQHRGPAGQQAQWVVFVLMVILSVTFIFMSWTLPAARRLVHSITTLIVVISALCYFAMANHSGYVMQHVRYPIHHKGKIPTTYKHLHREMYWVRYLEWAMITPLILLDLFFIAGVNGASIFSALSANFIMIFAGLFATFSHSKGEKWGWYTIACIAYLSIIDTLVRKGRQAIRDRGSKLARLYTMLTGYTLVVWTAYPIVWGVVAGSARNVGVNAEIITFAVLDVLAQGVFAAWLLFSYRRAPEARAEVGGFWVHGLGYEGQIRVGEEENGA